MVLEYYGYGYVGFFFLGRRSVGSNIMVTFCIDMRFCSSCSIILRRGAGGVGLGFRVGVVGKYRGFRFFIFVGSFVYLYRCWKSRRSVSWLGVGSERIRFRT